MTYDDWKTTDPMDAECEHGNLRHCCDCQRRCTSRCDDYVDDSLGSPEYDQ